MSSALFRPIRSLITAICGVLAASAITDWTWPLLQATPMALFYASVLIGARFGGLLGGALSIAASTVLAWYAFVPPNRSFEGDPKQTVPLIVFVMVASSLAWLLNSQIWAAAREREQRKWFEGTLASIGDGVIATTLTGRISFMNEVAARLTGWASGEARGRKLEEVFAIVGGRPRASVESPTRLALEAGHAVVLDENTVLISRDGTETFIEDSAAPIKDDQGRDHGVILVFRDGTEKRRTRDLTERLAAIVESSDDIIVSKTLDGIITGWNPGAERLLGYAPEEVIGKHVSLLMPSDVIEDTHKILGRIARGERVDHYETRRRRKDGTIIDVSLTVSPIRDDAGRIVGASKIGRDITALKQIEKERLEADRRKDEFLAMLAHELRNPLASIGNAAQFLDNQGSEEDLEWARDVVLRQVKHLSHLIDDLLDVSRISRGIIGLRKEWLDLSPIIDEAIEAVRPLMKERDHEVVVSKISGDLKLEADPVRLEQILVNLLTNAAKYTDPGGRITLEARQEAAEVVIRVRDTGMGIGSDLLPHVFDLFTQGERAIDRSEGGLGIGLTLVRKIAEMHGGSVVAASEGPGKGSEFTVRLPATEGIAPRSPLPAGAMPRAARLGSRVLVVDDNADLVRGISKLLKRFGHDVRVAHGGNDALEVAREHLPEVVLLDLGLPDINGYEVAKRLRAEAFGKTAIIIAVSGYGQPENLRRSREAGFDHHLVKPVDHEALMALIQPQPGG